MLNRFSVAKNLSAVKIGPQNGGFGEIWGSKYHIYIVTGTTKRHILGLNDVFRRIFRRNPFRVVGCSELQESKKALKTSHPMEHVEITYLGSENR